jgi:hypothetical protein
MSAELFLHAKITEDPDGFVWECWLRGQSAWLSEVEPEFEPQQKGTKNASYT